MPPVPAAAGAPKTTQRQWEIDALRGLMLVLMTLTHLPTRFSGPTSQPFGFVSAAEGFVLLSAFMAAKVYTGRQLRAGDDALTEGFLSRAVKIWLVQAALLVLLFSLIALLGALNNQPAVKNLMSFYLERPFTAVAAGLLLVYNPPLLDILPMYIVFMLVSPVLLLYGSRGGWRAIMASSIVLWAAAQAGLGPRAYDALATAIRLPVPAQQTGAFELFGWQMLWVIGLWMGGRAAQPGAAPERFPPWLVRTAWVIALSALVWRHAVGQTPWPAPGALPAAVNAAFDKWHLAPLRLVNLFALMVLAMHHAPWLSRHLPRPRALETLGAASLPVFCAHLVLALLTLALLGAANDQRPWTVDMAIVAGSFAVLYAVALASAAIDRHAAAVRARSKARRVPTLNAGALR